MSPDQIRRSWDDDDTPRSVFPEPLAERLARENKELRAENERVAATALTVDRELMEARAEVERLRGELAEERSARRADLLADIEETQDASDALIDALHALDYAKARHDALVADLRGLADGWGSESRRYAGYVAGSSIPEVLGAVAKVLEGDAIALRAVLDKHAGGSHD